VLYRLSYISIYNSQYIRPAKFMERETGIEPATNSLEG
jgi:hypothetical protein